MADDKPPLAAGPPTAPDAPSAAPPGAITAEPMNLPPIPLDHAAAKSAPAAPPIPAKNQDSKDAFRELIETIVFVVVLVLMLKTFLAEAFVIPTGSMATTLLGYHYKVTCEECGYPNLVNASAEAEPRDPRHVPVVVRWECINCKHVNKRHDPNPVKGLQP